MFFPRRIMSLTTETSTVMPRSLKEPVWLLPHILTQRSLMPSIAPKRFAQKRFVFPSNMDTMFSLSMPGTTHSFLLQMPLP